MNSHGALGTDKISFGKKAEPEAEPAAEQE